MAGYLSKLWRAMRIIASAHPCAGARSFPVMSMAASAPFGNGRGRLPSDRDTQRPRVLMDALAEATGRSRNHLVNEALKRYLDEERWQLAKIEEGINEADAGEFYSTEPDHRLHR